MVELVVIQATTLFRELFKIKFAVIINNVESNSNLSLILYAILIYLFSSQFSNTIVDIRFPAISESSF